MDDSYLRFWFRFIYPYQGLIEAGQTDLLRKYVLDNYELFSGRTLELWFQTRLGSRIAVALA